MSSRKRAHQAWIVVTLFAVPFLYVVSFGPACWWFSTVGVLPPASASLAGHASYTVPSIYWPMGYVAESCRRRPRLKPVYQVICWYAAVGRNSGDVVMIPTDSPKNLGMHLVAIHH